MMMDSGGPGSPRGIMGSSSPTTKTLKDKPLRPPQVLPKWIQIYGPWVAACVVTLLILHSMESNQSTCLLHYGSYTYEYDSSEDENYISNTNNNNNDNDNNSRCLVETESMKVTIIHHNSNSNNQNQNQNDNGEKHSTSTNKKGGKNKEDLLWIDAPNRVNVLLQEMNGNYLVLEEQQQQPQQPAPSSSSSLSNSNHHHDGMVQMQKKQQQQQLGLISGTVMHGETREMAVQQRLVPEEYLWHCESYEHLGRFQSDRQHGMGYVDGFLGQQCHTTTSTRLKSMSAEEIRNAVLEGHFVELSASNTVALALLYQDAIQLRQNHRHHQ